MSKEVMSVDETLRDFPIEETLDPMDNARAVYCTVFRGYFNPVEDQRIKPGRAEEVKLCSCGQPHYVGSVNKMRARNSRLGAA